MLRRGSSLAEHPAVRQGKINEEDDGEKDPACGDMEPRDTLREAVIPEHNKRSDSNDVAESMAKRPAQ
jgi:hypothetical protein